jgi:hypothetical protein
MVPQRNGAQVFLVMAVFVFGRACFRLYPLALGEENITEGSMRGSETKPRALQVAGGEPLATDPFVPSMT